MAVFGTLAACCPSFNWPQADTRRWTHDRFGQFATKPSQPHRVARTSTRAVESREVVSPLLEIALGTENRPWSTEKGS